jgi:hypothetical protein
VTVWNNPGNIFSRTIAVIFKRRHLQGTCLLSNYPAVACFPFSGKDMSISRCSILPPGFRGGCLVKVKQARQPLPRVVDSTFLWPRRVACHRWIQATADD